MKFITSVAVVAMLATGVAAGGHTGHAAESSKEAAVEAPMWGTGDERFGRLPPFRVAAPISTGAPVRLPAASYGIPAATYASERAIYTGGLPLYSAGARPIMFEGRGRPVRSSYSYVPSRSSRRRRYD